ncbi:MAG: thioesterase family protein [Actinomycetaceae bacterium]|nr:thioesterase family protein [Actinomycetaceae bacterium]MDY6083385.1 thioesterase family protein [Actinomycetaceae bacterium]
MNRSNEYLETHMDIDPLPIRLTRSFLDIPETHEEPLASILDALRLERIGSHLYRGINMPQVLGRVYGGQVFAQATMAAADTIEEDDPDTRLAHSITAAFLRPGDPHLPLLLKIEDLNDGHSFSTRNVSVFQHDLQLFHARVSFQLHQPGPTFAQPMPDAPDPESLPSLVELFTTMGSSMGTYWADMMRTNAIEMRYVDESIYLHPAKKREPHTRVWFRTRTPMPKNSSKTLQRALLGYAADQFMLDPIMRALGIYWTSPKIAVATLDHSIWWHRNFDISNWIYADLRGQSAQNGRGLVIAEFFQDGRLIATMSQEGMVRARPSSK